jgi:WD40 repeat protein
MFGHCARRRVGQLAAMSLAVVGLASACAPREAALETRLVPTRTPAPRMQMAMPTVTPTVSSPFGLTPQNADQLSRVFQTAAPLPQHIYIATSDRLVIYSAHHLELVAADTLELLARTPIQVSDADADIIWYAASANGRLGAVMSPSGKVDIYDLADSRLIRSFETPRPSTEIVSDIALTADGRELVIVSQATLSRLRLSDGERIDQGVSLPRSARAIRFAEDGTRLAAALASNEILIVQTRSGSPAVTLTLPFTSAPIVYFGFDPSGIFFAASSKEGLAVWDLSDDSPRLVKSFDLGLAVESSLERSGRFIAINLSPMVLVYDLKEDEPYAQFRLTGNLPVWSVHFDPSGERLFVAGSGELASFDIVNRRALQSVARPPLGRSVFSADGQTLFTWSSAFLSDEVIIFDVPSWEVRARLQHPSPVVRVMPDEAGRYVATLTLNREIAIWHALDGDLISRIDGPLTDTLRLMLCFTPDGRGLAYLDGQRVAIHDLSAKRDMDSFSLPAQPSAVSRCNNPAGRLAIASEQALRVLTLDGQVVATIKAPIDQMNVALDLSRDGGKLAALLGDQLTFWDVTTQQKLRTVTLSQDLLSGAFSPGGEHFALNFGDRVEIAHVTGSERAALKLPAEGVVAILFPPDPRVVITVAAPPSSTVAGRRTATTGELSIWDAQTGGLIRRITTAQPLASASISEDGALIAASTPDNTLLVWGLP